MKKAIMFSVAFVVGCLAVAIVGCAIDGAAEGKVAGRASTSPEVFPWAESRPESR